MRKSKVESKKPRSIILLIFVMGIFAFFFLFIGMLMIFAGSYGAGEEWAAQATWNGVLNLSMGVGFTFAIWGFGRKNALAYAVAISLYLVIILRYVLAGDFSVSTSSGIYMTGLVIACVIILFYLSRPNIREYFRSSLPSRITETKPKRKS